MNQKFTADVRREASGRARVYPQFTYVNTRFKKNLIRLLDAQAHKEGRKRASMVREIIKRYFEQRGMVIDEGYDY